MEDDLELELKEERKKKRNFEELEFESVCETLEGDLFISEVLLFKKAFKFLPTDSFSFYMVIKGGKKEEIEEGTLQSVGRA